jgi:hypothetical protein
MCPCVVSPAGLAKRCDVSDPHSFRERKEVKHRSDGAECHCACVRQPDRVSPP